MENITKKLNELERIVIDYVPLKKHDAFALETIKEAINAAKAGSFGVGAILVNNKNGKVIYRGRNKVFTESRSDLHAEMDLLNTFETNNKSESREMLKNLTLYTSLESCPMCLCRIITSGLVEVYHIADDNGGGMVHIYDHLPPVWKDISQGRLFIKAECSDDLASIAEQVFLLTVDLDKKLKTN